MNGNITDLEEPTRLLTRLAQLLDLALGPRSLVGVLLALAGLVGVGGGVVDRALGR